jgi:GT2 family glycosyltransferase
VADVSVCVVVRDRLHEMDRCLDAVLAQTVLPREVVVVVDAGSTEPVAARLRDRARSAPVSVLVLEDPGGVAHRRALAARTSRGELIAWTDSDCRPDPGWLEAGAAAFADPAVGVVQGRTRPQDVPVPRGVRGRWRATQQIDALTGFFETCNLFLRRAAYDQTGGFRASIGFWGEDTLLGWDVVAAGWTAGFAEEAVVEHDTSYPGFGWFWRRLRFYAQWPAILKASPEARRNVPHNRVFLRSRDRHITLAAVGLVLAVRWRPAALLVLPWLRLRRPGSLGRDDVVMAGQLLAHDAGSFFWILVGVARHRFFVL